MSDHTLNSRRRHNGTRFCCCVWRSISLSCWCHFMVDGCQQCNYVSSCHSNGVSWRVGVAAISVAADKPWSSCEAILRLELVKHQWGPIRVASSTCTGWTRFCTTCTGWTRFCSYDARYCLLLRHFVGTCCTARYVLTVQFTTES